MRSAAATRGADAPTFTGGQDLHDGYLAYLNDLSSITLGAADDVSVGDAQAFLDLQVAIEALEREDERAARAVVHSYFGGMSAEESALALQVSVATVERDLAFGRAFLRRRLGS